MSTDEFLAVECPYCGASPGFSCWSGNLATVARNVPPHASRKALMHDDPEWWKYMVGGCS